MTERQLKFFEETLNSWRTELVEGAGRTVSGMNDSIKDNFPDPADRASLESDRNATLRIRDRERKLLQKIDDALGRLREGTFGLCESCGEPIGFERLKARAVTTLCIGCKAEQEEEEKKNRH